MGEGADPTADDFVVAFDEDGLVEWGQLQLIRRHLRAEPGRMPRLIPETWRNRGVWSKKREMNGQESMGHLWEIYGKSMGHLWKIYGKSMGNLWKIYGTSMKTGMRQEKNGDGDAAMVIMVVFGI